MLVPQKPYMALGTLRQQLLYPVFDAAIVSEALQDNEDNFSKSGLLDFPLDSHPASNQDSRAVETNGDGSAAAGSNGKAGDGASERSVAKAEVDVNGNGKRSEQVPAPPDGQLLECLELVRAKALLSAGLHAAGCMHHSPRIVIPRDACCEFWPGLRTWQPHAGWFRAVRAALQGQC